MKPDKRKSEDAVSPVVGVMLMLVVVIIIAAVVSAFAGGLTKSNDKPSQGSISATFSQSKGMYVYYENGPTLQVSHILFLIRPGMKSADPDAISFKVNTSVIQSLDGLNSWNVANAIKPPSGGSAVLWIVPGDGAYISPQYLNWTQIRGDGVSEYLISPRGMGTKGMLGNQVTLEMYDKSSNNLVAMTEMTITP